LRIPFVTLKNYRPEYLPRDLVSGLIVAAMSIPISMGYAQIAGLPAVYGLYGSLLPILAFALLTNSPGFIFGVDAAPAAIVGAALAQAGVALGSAEAAHLVPVVTLFAAAWLLLFSLLGGGKLVRFVSAPVMGGFISGICVTIILMQIPKLLGGSAVSGELLDLLPAIAAACGEINLPSLLLGGSALALLRLGKKQFPKLPISVLLMALGALLETRFHLDRYGVRLLSAVEPGLPALSLPRFTLDEARQAIGISLPVAIVIMAESLLVENSFALKNDRRLDGDREILAFSAGNFVAALTGCCPVNGSLSRTSMAEQYGMCTQLASIAASAVMALVLLFGTGFIGFLPVPVLTAIVISALMGVAEFDLAARLRRTERKEYYIFLGAFFGVLLFGTVYGVVIGVFLSFLNVVLRAADPPRGFLGVVPGREGFCSLGRNRAARPIDGVAIYRFSGSLFFANVDLFQEDIEKAAAAPGTRAVLVDAGGIAGIDITAAERLLLLSDKLYARGIRFFITEHIGALNDRLRALGAGRLIDNGTVRRTFADALSELGLEPPYLLPDSVPDESVQAWYEETVRRYEWAYGEDADAQMEKHIREIIAQMDAERFESELTPSEDAALPVILDGDDLLSELEEYAGVIAEKLGLSEDEVEEKLSESRVRLTARVLRENPESLQRLLRRRQERDERMAAHRPEHYEKLLARRAARLERLRKIDPEAARLFERAVHAYKGAAQGGEKK
jgi:SulP family sulfate permease